MLQCVFDTWSTYLRKVFRISHGIHMGKFASAYMVTFGWLKQREKVWFVVQSTLSLCIKWMKVSSILIISGMLQSTIGPGTFAVLDKLLWTHNGGLHGQNLQVYVMFGTRYLTVFECLPGSSLEEVDNDCTSPWWNAAGGNSGIRDLDAIMDWPWLFSHYLLISHLNTVFV